MATRVKEKTAARKANADKRPRAIARYVRISSRKVKIVVDLIRGKKVDDALAILMYTPKSAAPVVEKLLNSAIANAENNLNMDRESLYVAEVYANQGPTMKRYWARSARPRGCYFEAQQPHYHRARPVSKARRESDGPESKSPRRARWCDPGLEHQMVRWEKGFLQ